MPSNTPTSTDLSAGAVRARFIRFFEDRAHKMVPSSTTVPTNDPSLRDTFANAGMNQYKPVFLGQVTPGSYLDGLKRAVNTQKCIRAGGKHNDLDDVGKDTYHHTFFEMLGNWSFGDYFKSEAIEWGFEFLVKEMGLDPDRLYASYFGGDPSCGLEPDHEARDLWHKYLPPERVLPFDMKDNFWEMGDTGPCGPCSEIHYDRVGGRDASVLVNADDPNVIEIWNLVFIQYDRAEGGKLTPLPAKHVDTGMGLERLVSVLQGKDSNYDTDLFTPLFEAIQRLTGARAYTGKLGGDDADGVDEAYRVVADHARTLTFAITDGGMPGNEGRGYVLRRILRRAVRYGRQKLGAPSGFFAKLVPVVVELMGEAFPELTQDPGRVVEIVRDEEESFEQTLDKGALKFDEFAVDAVWKHAPMAKFDEVMVFARKSKIFQTHQTVKAPNKAKNPLHLNIEDNNTAHFKKHWKTMPTIEGTQAFQLYDTYGFPLDLTEIMAAERGLAVDVEGFHKCMAEQKARSRAGGRAGESRGLTLTAEQTAELANRGIAPTDDAPKFGRKDIRATVKAIWDGTHFVNHAKASVATTHPVGVVLDRTNCYAEMGGQETDHGRLELHHGPAENARAGELRVEDVRTYAGFVVHGGHMGKGELRVGDEVVVHVDASRRAKIESNHTATHMLNHKLRAVLGAGVDQRGSLVAPDRLRFDFTHNHAVKPDELAQIEALVREDIAADLEVFAQAAPLQTAQMIAGLRAVFDEHYPDPVRVVSIGAPVDDLLGDPTNERWGGLSVEFCGGTHLERTGQAGAFALVSEEAVAKGIRRVTALTGVPAQAAIAAAGAMDVQLDQAERLEDKALPAAIKELTDELDGLTLPAARKAAARARLGSLAERAKKAQKAASAGRAAEAQQLAEQIAAAANASPELVIVSTIGVGSDRKALEAALKTIQAKCTNQAVMLLSTDDADGKVAVMACVPKNLVGMGLRAGDWIREVTTVLGGKGGGRPEMAQGGGTDPSKVKEAIAAARSFAFTKIG